MRIADGGEMILGGRDVESRSGNMIIAALPAVDASRILSKARRIKLEEDQILVDANARIDHVYFLESGVVSLVTAMAPGAAVETAIVGREGLVGLPVFFGVECSASQAVCQIEGTALRMDAAAFRSEVHHRDSFGAQIGLFAQALHTQTSQASACTAAHLMRQRCARRLLQLHDRVGGKSLALSSAFLAHMAGARLAAVHEAAQFLHEAKAIEYAPGSITIRDRAALEAITCGCYDVIKQAYARLLNDE